MRIEGRARPRERENDKAPFAGLFGVLDDSYEGELSLDEKFIRHRHNTFFVRLGSDSMNPVFSKDDLLIVDTSLKIFEGAYVVGFLDGVPLCRKYSQKKLIALDPNKKEIDLETQNFEFFGIVTSLVRSFV